MDELVGIFEYTTAGRDIGVNSRHWAMVATMTMADALIQYDPFQPMDHEKDVYAGRLPYSQRARWYVIRHCDDCMAVAMGERSCCAFHFAPYEAVCLSQLSAFDCNVIAQLLEDRAAMSTRNAIQCTELYAGETSDYWTGQHDHAAKLARQFRDAGK